MKIAYIDVESARPESQLTEGLIVQGGTSASQALAKQIIDLHRETADRIAREAGGELRTDHKPEFYLRRGADIVAGGEDLLLTASRWAIWVPDNFDPERASAASR